MNVDVRLLPICMDPSNNWYPTGFDGLIDIVWTLDVGASSVGKHLLASNKHATQDPEPIPVDGLVYSPEVSHELLEGGRLGGHCFFLGRRRLRFFGA